jgi:hypothetical protein
VKKSPAKNNRASTAHRVIILVSRLDPRHRESLSAIQELLTAAVDGIQSALVGSMKTFPPTGRLMLLLTLVLLPAASAGANEIRIQNIQTAAFSDPTPPSVKRANAKIYLSAIDQAIGVLDSSLSVPRKKALLHRFIQTARSWKNLRAGEYSDPAQAELDTYERWVDGGHFLLLGANLVSVRIAVWAFL